MASGNKPLKQIQSVLNISEIYCLCCGEKYGSDTYYESDSLQYRAYGKIPYCKDCIDKMYQGYLSEFKKLCYTDPERKAVQRLCMALDLFYRNDIFESAVKEWTEAKIKFKNDEIVFITYFIKHSKMYQYRKRNYNSTINDEYKSSKDRLADMSVFNAKDSEHQEKIAKAVKIFGAGFPDDDYLWLYDAYQDWTSRNECQTMAQEENFKAICFNRLNAYKANLRGDSTKDLDKTFNELLNTGNLQPKQNKESLLSEKMSFGEMVSRWENVVKKPIPKPTGHLADIDHIAEADGFMRGHTIVSVGEQPNSYSETYKKLMRKFTVGRPEFDEDNFDSDDTFDRIAGERIDNMFGDGGGNNG